MADSTSPSRSRTRGSFAMIPRWVRQRLAYGTDDVALWLYLHLADVRSCGKREASSTHTRVQPASGTNGGT
jgi:hypothetical protein